MSRLQKILLFVLMVGLVTTIIITWGSIGSAVLTLALLVTVGYLLLQKIMENRDPDDFRWEA